MKIMLLMVVLVTGFQIQGASSFEVSKKSCKGIDIKIAKLNSQLRNGYTLKKGEVMKNKLRLLKKNKFQCKKKWISTE